MHDKQKRHIEDVIKLVRNPLLPLERYDLAIQESWHRCVHTHGLDPEQMQDAMVLPEYVWKVHQQSLDELVFTAEASMKALWQQINAMGYVVLLADINGVIVEALGRDTQVEQLRRAGLYAGAIWKEAENGTSAVGTALATRQAITVHQQDHFDATHIHLTCSAAPIFDSHDQLRAVLNVSALQSEQVKHAQSWVFYLVQHYAALIENVNFIHAYGRHWLVKLSESVDFLELNPSYLLAVDDNGRICAANHAFYQWAKQHAGLDAEQLRASSFELLFDVALPRLYARATPDRRIGLGESWLYASVLPSPGSRHRTAVALQSALPEPLARLCGPDSCFRGQLQRLAHTVDTTIPILLNGETGCGKEVLARAIHDASRRAQGPFVAVNCAAIAESLIESELYGYAPNSFSGAHGKGKTGLIQAADGGTLFLDEIGDMPLYLQSRLLRVLSEREVLPVGSTRAIKVDIRIVAATHCNLLQAIEHGRFREDLYYRLNGLQVRLPALRERDDFDAVVDGIVSTCDAGAHPVPKEIAPDARLAMRSYAWPGNIRQLRSVLEVAVLMSDGVVIRLEDLPEEIRAETTADIAPVAVPTGDVDKSILESRQDLVDALERARWNITRLARAMGVSRMTVYRYIQKYAIVKAQSRQDAGSASDCLAP